MVTKDLYRHIYSSLLRACSDFSEEMQDHGHDLGVVNLDAFTDEIHWPARDFVGVGEISVMMEDTAEVECMFSIATMNDTNLLRMAELVNHLVNKLMPNENLPIYHAVTGAELGKFLVGSGTTVNPPFPTKSLPIQAVNVKLLTNLRCS